MKSPPISLAAPQPQHLRAAARDDARLEAALVACRTRLFRGALLLLGCRDDAEDLTQRALLKAWQSRGGFRGGCEPYTWLYRILINLCKDHFKARSRADRWLEEFAPVARNTAVAARLPDELLVRAERDEQLRRALARLSEPHRRILVLRHFEEMSYDELASILECPIGTVRSRLSTARTRLRRELEREREQGESDDV